MTRSTLPFLSLAQLNEPSVDWFALQCRARDGELYSPERTGLDSEDRIVADICTGQLTDVVSVFVFNPVEGSSREITEDIARTVLGKVMDDEGEVSDLVRPFLEDQLGFIALADAETV